MQTEVLVAILVLIFTDIAIHTAGLDVKQFVNRLEPIWTYKTTRRGHIKCEVDQLVSTRPLSITFKRCAFLRGNRCDLRILGVFDTQHKDRMTILHRDTFRRVEKLLFMALDRSCAVFKGVQVCLISHTMESQEFLWIMDYTKLSIVRTYITISATDIVLMRPAPAVAWPLWSIIASLVMDLIATGTFYGVILCPSSQQPTCHYSCVAAYAACVAFARLFFLCGFSVYRLPAEQQLEVNMNRANYIGIACILLMAFFFVLLSAYHSLLLRSTTAILEIGAGVADVVFVLLKSRIA
ncbi:hypothetical protein MTO96_024711 [Rhipicephalus appendiculatus]